MRRFERARRKPGLRTGELLRLASMLGMLGVLYLLIESAKDERNWRWLAPSGSSRAAVVEPSERSLEAAAKPAEPADEALRNDPPKPLGPTDADPLEADAAREELAAVSDKTALAKEEMPAYWRLMSWSQRQPIRLLEQRARRDVSFSELMENPDRYRGKLLAARLHLVRMLTYETEDRLATTRRLYEAWGWSDDSRPWLWVTVFPEKPDGMAVGRDIREEVTFYGYFLKIMAYEAGDQPRTAPLLVGRIVWHPLERPAAQPLGGWSVLVYVLGAAAIFAMGSRWMFRRSTTRQRRLLSEFDPQAVPIEDWLARGDREADPREESTPPRASGPS